MLYVLLVILGIAWILCLIGLFIQAAFKEREKKKREKKISISTWQIRQSAAYAENQRKRKEEQLRLEEEERKKIEEAKCKETAKSYCSKYPFAVELITGRRNRLTKGQINQLLSFTETEIREKEEMIIAGRNAKVVSLCKQYPNAVKFYFGSSDDIPQNKVQELLDFSEELLISKEKLVKEQERISKAKKLCVLYPNAIKEILQISNYYGYLTAQQADILTNKSELELKEREEEIIEEQERIKAEKAQRDREVNNVLDYLDKKYPKGLIHVKKLRSEKARIEEIYTEEEWNRLKDGHNVKKSKASLIYIPENVYEKYEEIAIRYNSYQEFLKNQETINKKIKESKSKRYQGWNKSTFIYPMDIINLLGEKEDHEISITHLFLNSNASTESATTPRDVYCKNIIDIINSISVSPAVIFKTSGTNTDNDSEPSEKLKYLKQELEKAGIECFCMKDLEQVKDLETELLVLLEETTTTELLGNNYGYIHDTFENIPIVYISLFKEYNQAELEEIRQKEENARILKEIKEKKKKAQEEKDRLKREAEEKARIEREKQEEAARKEEEARKLRERMALLEKERIRREEWEAQQRIRHAAEERARKEREEQQRKEAIRTYLQEKGVYCFYHFTDRRNLESIKRHGGLYSWDHCVRKGIEIPYAGGNESSRNLDRRYHLQDYVRLSFCEDHPMKHSLRQQGRDLVLLKVKPDIAELETTLFCDMNATDNGCSFGAGMEYLKKVDIDAVKERFVRKDSPNFKKHQAEVMVKNFVPLENILNIDNPQTLN